MDPIRKIVILGNGLAGHLSALALAKRLPQSIELILVKSNETVAQDVFYGNLTPSSTYDFLLGLGITEPELLLSTQTSFSLGTAYENWGPNARQWTQAFHRPLPIHDGVKFHHYVKRHKKDANEWDLSPYIMSIEAAKKGVFAHPPEGKNIPLASIEYGYHFTPDELTAVIAKHLENSAVKVIDGTPEPLKHTEGQITTIHLKSRESIEADFIIDCTSQSRESVDDTWPDSHKVSASFYTLAQDEISSVIRTVKQTKYGWRSETPLRNRLEVFCLSHPNDTNTIDEIKGVSLSKKSRIFVGRSVSPWTNNVVKLGHNAGAIEPLTPAPIILLQHDIDRLTDLIPTSKNMHVEAKEYNRRYIQDFDNADMFQRAFYLPQNVPQNNYQAAVLSRPIPPKLQTKLTQFKSRGTCVLFDNEPFTEEDWTVLHLGMGLIPERYDLLTERLSDEHITQMLSNMNRAIIQMGAKMPPINVYMAGLLKFLKDKHG